MVLQVGYLAMGAKSTFSGLDMHTPFMLLSEMCLAACHAGESVR